MCSRSGATGFRSGGGTARPGSTDPNNERRRRTNSERRRRTAVLACMWPRLAPTHTCEAAPSGVRHSSAGAAGARPWPKSPDGAGAACCV
jgi:hypothetical protein